MFAINTSSGVVGGGRNKNEGELHCTALGRCRIQRINNKTDFPGEWWEPLKKDHARSHDLSIPKHIPRGCDSTSIPFIE